MTDHYEPIAPAEDVLDLGSASLETRGVTSPLIEEIFGWPVSGLADDT